MGSKKLVYCCIVGILLGFLAPLVLKTDKHTSLMVGMVAGLGIGYLLDVRDSKQSDHNKLLERARRGVENEYLRMDYDEEEPSDEPEEEVREEESEVTRDPDAEADERAEKLNEAQELLRAARERMK